MHASVTGELRRGVKKLQTIIHPDKFASHPAEVSRGNGEAFKIVGSLVSSVCGLIDLHAGGRLYFPFAINRLAFYRGEGQNLHSIKHTLPFAGRLATADDRSLVGWEEAALSVFHLFTKTHIDYDQRLSQWLLSSPGPSPGDFTDFEGLLQFSQTRQNEPFDLLECMRDIRKLANVRLSRGMGRESIKIAVRSIWDCRDIFCKIQQTRPAMSFLVTDSAPHALTTSFPSERCRTVVLPITFSPLEVSRYAV